MLKHKFRIEMQLSNGKIKSAHSIGFVCENLCVMQKKTYDKSSKNGREQ